MIFVFDPLQAQQHYSLEIHCKPEYHRFLIGRGGANIRKACNTGYHYSWIISQENVLL